MNLGSHNTWSVAGVLDNETRSFPPPHTVGFGDQNPLSPDPVCLLIHLIMECLTIHPNTNSFPVLFSALGPEILTYREELVQGVGQLGRGRSNLFQRSGTNPAFCRIFTPLPNLLHESVPPPLPFIPPSYFPCPHVSLLILPFLLSF